MRVKAITALVLAVLLLTSCMSTTQRAQQALDSGDYQLAVSQSLEALSENSSDPEAKAVLTSAWNRANSEWRSQIEQLLEAESAQEKRRALSYFDALISIHEMVSSAPTEQPESRCSIPEERVRRCTQACGGCV